MKLYHYNEKPFDVLVSLYGRGVTEEDKKRLGHYADKSEDVFTYTKHLSFFLEPIPKDLPSILHNEHPFWTSGKVLQEHIVDTSALKKDVPYRLVESVEKTELIYKEQNWDLAANNPELTAEYKRQIAELEKRLNHKGYGVINFTKAAGSYKGISTYYKNMYNIHKKFPEDNLMSKYAACVPHLMLYTAKDKVIVTKINEITLK